MTDRLALLERVAGSNPYPATEDLPSAVQFARPDASIIFLAEDLATGVAIDWVVDEESGAGSRSLWQGPLVAASVAVAVMLVFVVGSFLFGGADSLPPTATVTTAPPTTVPVVETAGADPWGLSESVHPIDQDEVNWVFLELPDWIDGMTATKDDPQHIGFVEYAGENGRASVAYFEAGPDAASTIAFLTSIEVQDDFTTTGGNLMSDGDFIWLTGIAVQPDGLVYLAWWGNPTDGQIFSAEADSEDRLNAVIDAYVETIAHSIGSSTWSPHDFDVVGPSIAGRSVSKAGFVVTESPFALTIVFIGRPIPDAVQIGEDFMESGDAYADWGATAEVELLPGWNDIPIVVHDNGDTFPDNVRIRYEPSGTGQLVSILEANEASITVDILRWDTDREFPGPVDDNPGETKTVAVTRDVTVSVDTDYETDYPWLLQAIKAASATEEPHWTPGYPYWITTDAAGTVIEILMIPLG